MAAPNQLTNLQYLDPPRQLPDKPTFPQVADHLRKVIHWIRGHTINQQTWSGQLISKVNTLPLVTYVAATQLPYTVLSTDNFLAVSGGTGTNQIFLPQTQGLGRNIIVKKMDANNSPIVVSSTETIDNASTFSIWEQWGVFSFTDAQIGQWLVS